jgi:uroporphyrinogen-III decarboxylase
MNFVLIIISEENNMIENNPEKLYKERETRFTDAIQLKIPDRVPVMIEFSYFPAKYTGITCEAAHYDYDLWLKANLKTINDYAPDVVQIIPFFPGSFYDMLESRQLKLPGRGIDPNHSHQFLEGEFIKAEDYDDLIDNRTDFMIRTFLPRIFKALEPFSKLPPFDSTTFCYYQLPALAESLASPDIYGALEKLLKAGQEISRWRSKMNAFSEEIEKLGFPLYGTSGEHVPFDHISYQMRGMRGIDLDMYRQPEKLIKVFDWMLPLQIKKATAKARKSGRKRVFFALHRGADNFMSNKQFETFYWPYAKKIVQALVDEGLTPCLFLEGDYTSRLEYFLELPRGKVLGRFDSTDIFKAKEILNRHMCIMGNVPASLLQTGTIQDVEDYCKKLIDIVGKDGGFIMAPRSTPDEAKPENLNAMVDFTVKYGVYR